MDKKTKIVHIIPYWYPILGGITSHVSNLIKNIDNKKFDIKILVRYGSNQKGAIQIGSNKFLFIFKCFWYLI